VLVDDSRQEFIGEDRLPEFAPTIVIYGVEPLLPRAEQSPTGVVPRIGHAFPVKALPVPSGLSAAAFGIRPAGGEYLSSRMVFSVANLKLWC